MLEFISKYGIAIIRSELAKNAEEARKVADGIGYPVVMKISSPDPIHKTDIGGVKIDVKKEYVEATFNEMIENAAKAKVRCDGVLVQEQAPPGLELIAGLKLDAQFRSHSPAWARGHIC